MDHVHIDSDEVFLTPRQNSSCRLEILSTVNIFVSKILEIRFDFFGFLCVHNIRAPYKNIVWCIDVCFDICFNQRLPTVSTARWFQVFF